jgi:hypothetical protein
MIRRPFDDPYVYPCWAAVTHGLRAAWAALRGDLAAEARHQGLADTAQREAEARGTNRAQHEARRAREKQ